MMGRWSIMRRRLPGHAAEPGHARALYRTSAARRFNWPAIIAIAAHVEAM